jgi:hypothetical protein
MDKHSMYRSYLFRTWKETERGEWRASIQDVVTNECHLFSSLDALFNFLKEQTEIEFQDLWIRRKDLEPNADEEE